VGWIWAALFAAGVLAEIVALVRKQPGDTLSENLRRLVTRHPYVKWGTLAAWLAFAVWFALHIWL
jgi:hypothetical protein